MTPGFRRRKRSASLANRRRRAADAALHPREVVDRGRPMRATVRCGGREPRMRRMAPARIMSEHRGRDRAYVMGRTADETRRLQDRAKFFAPLTRHFFEDAGIGAGMSVLDIGSGAGDVSLLV